MMTRQPLFPFRLRKQRRAFTMVEIMIVILITMIIVAIAVPTWLKSRDGAQAKTCQETQAQLEGAVDRWAFEHNKQSGEDGPTYEEIVGPESLLKKTPKCPVGLTLYEIPKVGFAVECPNVAKYPSHERR